MQELTEFSTSTDPVPLAWVESLFSRMQAMYGAKFLDMWRDTDIKQVKALWAEEMGKLTHDELRRGFAALRTEEWPPTLPAYIKMCRPSLDSTVAYYQAVAGCQARSKGEIGEWPHPAIYWASRPLSFDLLNNTYSQVKTRWEAALAEQMAKSAWNEIPKPVLALAAHGKAELSKEKAAKMMADYKVSDIAKSANDKVDHKRWARLIMARIERKDRTVTPIQHSFAIEALNSVG